VTIKRLTFVRRVDGVGPDEFGERWRVQSLQMHEAVPDGARVQRLVHCVVRPGRTDRPHHGVAIEWFADEAALAAHDAHARSTPGDTLVDSASVVRARVESRTVFGQEQLDAWWSARGGAPRLLVIGVIERSPALDREAFRDYWWGDHRPLANRLLPPEVQPEIYVHDYALPGEPCPWDGVGEFYDTSVDVARARTRWADDADEAEAIIADEEKFLVRDTRYGLVTDAEVIISERQGE
jgi:EthD domain